MEEACVLSRLFVLISRKPTGFESRFELFLNFVIRYAHLKREDGDAHNFGVEKNSGVDRHEQIHDSFLYSS